VKASSRYFGRRTTYYTNREIERQRGKKIGRQTKGQRYRDTEIQIDRQIERERKKRGRETKRQRYRDTERQTQRQTERQRGRETEIRIFRWMER